MIEDIEKWRSELVTKVYFDGDKVLLNEAIDCLKSKSYRAGYIVSWLSIVESLRNKIKELSVTGNSQAENSLALIEKEEAALKSNDIKIVEEALTCGFLSKMEKEEVLFLWTQRCKFAHPYYLAPTEYELVFTIEKSISLALSKQILFKKDYIEKLISDICDTPHFIKDDYRSVVAHAKDKLSRIDPNLHSFFFKSLFYKLSEAIDKESSQFIVKRIIFYLTQIIVEAGDRSSAEEWKLEDRATKFPNRFCLLVRSETWKTFNRRIKELCLQYIKSDGDDEDKRIGRMRFKNLVKKGTLEEPFLADFYLFLNTAPFYVASELYQAADANLKSRVNEMIESTSYTENGRLIDFLYTEDGARYIDKLEPSDLKKLGGDIVYSAWRNCFASKSFIKNFAVSNEKIFYSIVEGCFYTEQNTLFLYGNIFKSILYQVQNGDDSKMEGLLARIDIRFDSVAFDHESYNSNILTTKNEIESIFETNTLKPFIEKTLRRTLDKINSYLLTASRSIR